MTGEIPWLDEPADELQPLVDEPRALSEFVERLAQGTGPIAFDAERAHGHRYHPKAYLFQLRRTGIGTVLIDPVALEMNGTTDLGCLVEATGDAEWIVHSAGQDLPCMVADNIVPPRIFDTELAAQVLGYDQIGLAALVERHFGVRLRKAHSADNWSTRPLPRSWLFYAALDVELLIELREKLAVELDERDRTEWAAQEFNHVLTRALEPEAPRVDRWRRLSGLKSVASRRGLAIAKALWDERDAIAAGLDRPVGRLLPDAGIIRIASDVRDTGPLPGRSQLASVDEFHYRGARRYTLNWLNAIDRVAALRPEQYPAKRPPRTDHGNPRSWTRRHPEAYARWLSIRTAADDTAAGLGIAPAVLIAPAILREIAFTPPTDIGSRLTELGARPWQVGVVAGPLSAGFADPLDDAPGDIA